MKEDTQISPLETQEDADRLQEIRHQILGLVAEARSIARKHDFEFMSNLGWIALIRAGVGSSSLSRAQTGYECLSNGRTLEWLQVSLRNLAEDSILDALQDVAE